MSPGASWAAAIAVTVLPAHGLASVYLAPPSRASSTWVHLLLLCLLLTTGVDALYLSSTAFASSTLKGAAIGAALLPSLWFYGVLATRFPLSLLRLTNKVVYNDPHCDETTMRTVTPLVALERARVVLDPGEVAPSLWWAISAPALARLGTWRKAALTKADIAPSQRSFETWTACASAIRLAGVLLSSTTLLPCATLNAASLAAYLCLRGPLLLRLDLLAHPAIAHAFFLRSPGERLSHSDLAFLFATRSASAALLGCLPMLALVPINSSLLQLQLVGYWAAENQSFAWSNVAQASMAIHGATVAAVAAFWLSSYFMHRPPPPAQQTAAEKAVPDASGEEGEEVASAAPPTPPAMNLTTRLLTSMAHWDCIMLDDALGGGAATPEAEAGQPGQARASAGTISAQLHALLSRAVAGSAGRPVGDSDAVAARPSPVVEEDEAAAADVASPASGGFARHVLTEHTVARGLRVELKPEAPPRHRLDDPSRLLVGGAQGTLDEDGPCASPFVVWDGGAGRIFCHTEDLWLLVQTKARVNVVNSA